MIQRRCEPGWLHWLHCSGRPKHSKLLLLLRPCQRPKHLLVRSLPSRRRPVSRLLARERGPMWPGFPCRGCGLHWRGRLQQLLRPPSSRELPRAHRCQFLLGPTQLQCRQHPPVSRLLNRWFPLALGRELAVPRLEMLLPCRPRLTTTRKVRRLCSRLGLSRPQVIRSLLRFLLLQSSSRLPPQPMRHQLVFPHLPVEMRSIIVSLQQLLLSANTFQTTQLLVCLSHPSFLKERFPRVPHRTLHN